MSEQISTPAPDEAEAPPAAVVNETLRSVVHELDQEIDAAKILRENLRDLIGEDDEALRDTLEGETQLHELIEQVVEFLGQDEERIAGIKEAVAQSNARKARLEKRVEMCRTVILNAMDVGELKKLELPIATVSRRATPAKVIITNEADVPSSFWTPQAPKLDKKLVKAALDSKKAVPGAELSNGGETLSIRRS